MSELSKIIEEEIIDSEEEVNDEDLSKIQDLVVKEMQKRGIRLDDHSPLKTIIPSLQRDTVRLAIGDAIAVALNFEERHRRFDELAQSFIYEILGLPRELIGESHALFKAIDTTLYEFFLTNRRYPDLDSLIDLVEIRVKFVQNAGIQIGWDLYGKNIFEERRKVFGEAATEENIQAIYGVFHAMYDREPDMENDEDKAIMLSLYTRLIKK